MAIRADEMTSVPLDSSAMLAAAASEASAGSNPAEMGFPPPGVAETEAAAVLVDNDRPRGRASRIDCQNRKHRYHFVVERSRRILDRRILASKNNSYLC